MPTSRYSLPYPALADAPNGPSQIQSLATATDTALGTVQDGAAAAALPAVNPVVNGDGAVAQTGTSFSATGHTFDLWSATVTGLACTITRQALGAGTWPGCPPYFLRHAVTGSDAASEIASHQVRLPGSVRDYAGKQVTLPVMLACDAASKKIAVEIVQYFGTGGSPSATVRTYAGQITCPTVFAATGTPQSITVTIPSISGKTIGTAEDSYLAINFILSAGSDFNSRTGSLGHQNQTFDIASPGLCLGAAAYPMTQPDGAATLAECQRQLVRWTIAASANASWLGSGVCDTSAHAILNLSTPVPMRAMPAVSYSALGDWATYTTGATVANAIAVAATSAWAAGAISLLITTGATLTPGHGAVLINQTNPSWLQLDARPAAV